MIITIESDFNIDDIVYLVTDTEQLERLVVGINVSKGHNVYHLMQGITSTWHFASEIGCERDVLKMINN